MAKRGEALVAVIKDRLDFAIAHDEHWYRIPVERRDKMLKHRWPPRWLAFYQPKIFGHEAYAVNYFAKVLDIREVARWGLFPDEPRDERAMRRYFRIQLEPLQTLPVPIVSLRQRRIVFIPTTLRKLTSASEINELYDESPLEDRLWSALRKSNIYAERQELVTVSDRNYILDFAVYCGAGKLDIETDGDKWHANPERATLDNRRDNDLESVGWTQLRFSTCQIREQMVDYCLPTISKTVNNLGGIEVPGTLGHRRIERGAPEGLYQLGLPDGS